MFLCKTLFFFFFQECYLLRLKLFLRNVPNLLEIPQEEGGKLHSPRGLGQAQEHIAEAQVCL